MEFSFCMIIVLLMIFATMMIFRWTGLDLVQRRTVYEESLVQDAEEDYVSRSDGKVDSGPIKQLQTYFSEPMKMNAVWQGNYEPWMEDE